MALLFDVGIFSVEDTAGAVVSGATLTFYTTGTTAPLATYSDSGLTTPNANPVIAGADGRFGPIWLQPANYKVVLKSASGATLVTRDPVVGALTGSNVTVAAGGTLAQAIRGVAVTPEQFGATGDGTADDTAECQAALDSGYDVTLPSGKTYKTTSTLTMNVSLQRFGGSGILKPVGSIDVVKVTGGAVGCEVDLTFNSSGHSGGYAVKIDNADRTRIRKLLMIDGYSVLYIQDANTTIVDFLWATARGAGIKIYGTDLLRSDVILIDKAVIDCAATEYGLDIDGNVFTVTANYLGLVTNKGAVIRNTPGAANIPGIIKLKQIEVDFSTSHGIEIIAGQDIDLAECYFQGSVGSGIKIGAAINNYEVRIGLGKSRGNTRYGIENAGGVVLYAGAMDLSLNTIAETTGNVWTVSPRIAVDANLYRTLSSGNPLDVFDANDYFGYDRTNNVGAWYVGGNVSLQYDGSRVTASLPFRKKSYTAAQLAAIASPLAGDTALCTDANASTFGTAVAGGGANEVPVTYRGGGWKIG